MNTNYSKSVQQETNCTYQEDSIYVTDNTYNFCPIVPTNQTYGDPHVAIFCCDENTPSRKKYNIKVEEEYYNMICYPNGKEQLVLNQHIFEKNCGTMRENEEIGSMELMYNL